MKKILFIVNSGKISPNENGGSAVYFSHLSILYKLGYSVDLLIIEWDKEKIYKESDSAEISHKVNSISVYKSSYRIPSNKFMRLYDALFLPEIFEYTFLNTINKTYLENIVEEKSIDLVWTEWRWTALLAWYSKLKIPVLYSHHDWEYKLAKLRKKRSLLEKFHTFQKKRIEFFLVKGVAACVSGSFTEKNEIESISKKQALYLPTTYQDVHPTLISNKAPNIVHLGGMGTTANRIGLERFLDVCWESIKKAHPHIKLLVVGSVKNIENRLKNKLNDSQIICTGFVEDLTTVLQPNDIHIIPWEFNTGTRTRVPVVFNYHQLLVATKASVAAFPEVINDKNSLLCNTLEEMTKQLIDVLCQHKKIELLSSNGKKTFLNSFTSESQKEKLNTFLENSI